MSEPTPPPPVDDDVFVLPASFGQERMWILEQMVPGTAANNLPIPLRLHGPLDRAALERSLAEIVARHETLRTGLVMEDGALVQLVSPHVPLPLSYADLSHVSASEREARAHEDLTREIRVPFDLRRGPLFRARLLKLDEGEHLLVITLHHIAADGWSFGVLLRELGVHYEAFAAGRPTPLPELPLQYGDFAAWQRERLRGEALARQLEYWKEAHAGELPVLAFPTDHPRPPHQSFRGGIVEHLLPMDAVAGLRTLAAAEGATDYMSFLAVYVALLHRHTGQADFVIGSPIANRNRVELESLIGLFINTLPLRLRLDPAAGFRALLRHVREATLDALANGEVPFERVVDALRIPRDPSRNPLFQTVFICGRAFIRPPQVPGLEITKFRLDRGGSAFDLSFWLVDDDTSVRASFEYDAALFEATALRHALGHYARLLEAAALRPDEPVGALPLLSQEERHLVEVEWNRTEEPAPNEPVTRSFEHQARQTPENEALSAGGQVWTYRQLNARANRLARRLRALGVGRDHLVGLCSDRGLDMVAGALGIMKAGAAYVPIDPDYPRERISYMLGDSGARLLVTEEQLLPAFEDWHGKTLCLDHDRSLIESEDPEDLAEAPSPNDLAYVIYTSGSTGRPKGVQIEHAALANFLASMAVRPGIAASDVLLAVTTLSFDIAGLELYLPLVRGARIVLASRDEAADPLRLAGLLERSGATVMQATPATWRMLLDAGWAGSQRLRVLCGGEALPVDLGDALVECCAELWNLYGPTETTIWSTVAHVTSCGQPAPVGRPIANTSVYILDGLGQSVPVGTTGEIWIGGLGVARGYLGRAELTAERFVADPFAGRPGARMYRTGDLGRFRPDGVIECLGRADTQVKVRGHRIELGEIETVLQSHPGVLQAVVVARNDAPGQTRLVAYVVPNGGDVAAPELRKLVRRTLPDYMVPSVYVRLDAVPRTPNGKIDRKALPPPEPVSEAPAQAHELPRNSAERIVAESWGKALGVEGVGIHDNFFDLGGHSLLSLQVVADLESRTGRRISPRDLMFQTLEQVAAAFEDLDAAPASPGPTVAIDNLARPTSEAKGLIATLKGLVARRQDES